VNTIEGAYVMRLFAPCAVVIAFLVATPGIAQSRQTVIITTAASVFVSPTDNQAPLRIAKEGSTLLLLDSDGEWYHVEFNDPDLGRRTGYVQRKFARMEREPEPVKASNSQTASPQNVQPQPTPSKSPSSISQRGDVAFGYVFAHDYAVSSPFGVAGSDAWRVHPDVDLVIESQFTHGNFDVLFTDVGVNTWTLMSGPRFWGGSRYGQSIRAFGQVLAGVMGGTVKVGSFAIGSAAGFGMKPGFGVEVPVARAVAIRPQFDVLIGRLKGQTTKDVRFNVNAVFRLFR
jgi:hypothetical protein